jgi:hypothetical protein
VTASPAGEQLPGSADEPAPGDSPAKLTKPGMNREYLELLVVVVLSITTILTAWTAFQSSKWGGAMSISFSQASTARIESVKLTGTADQRTAIHVGLWTTWLSQYKVDEQAAAFLEQRFPEPLATANADWLATRPLRNADAPPSPFAMPSYVIPEREAAAAADVRADAKFAEALAENQRGDNYTLLTVLFAAVLFFAAISNRLRTVRLQAVMLGASIALGMVGVVLLISFPKLV